MGHRAPEGWPEKLEHNGGAVAFFRIDWSYCPSEPFTPEIVRERPSEHTGFDWKAWIARPIETEIPVAEARLADRDPRHVPGNSK